MTEPTPKLDFIRSTEKSIARFATWYQQNKDTFGSFADAVDVYYAGAVAFAKSFKAETDAEKHIAQCLFDVLARIDAIMIDCAQVKNYEAFAEDLAEEFDLFASIAFSGVRYKPDTKLDSLGEKDAITYLLSKAQPYVVYLSDGAATGKPCTLFNVEAKGKGLPDSPPSGFSFAPASKALARAQYESRSTKHKGLPTLVISMAALPPQMFTVILEILARQSVCGLAFTGAGKRNNAPEGALGLRSFHQNEMGLLPAPAQTEDRSERCTAYHDLFEAEGEESLQGKQKSKGVVLEETCLFEFNAKGFNNTNIRLVYDSSRDQFYLTFHYQVMLIQQGGNALTCVDLASNADTLSALAEPRPGADKAWVSSMILINVPQAVKLAHIRVPVKAVVANTDKPFTLMPVGPKFVLGTPCVSVGAALLQSAAQNYGLNLGAGSDENIVIFEKVKTSKFDLHLSCVLESKVADTFHLAIRTNGRHGSVLYWWFRLVWTNAPDIRKVGKGQVFTEPKLQWQIDGPVNGHGAAHYQEMWDSIKVFGDLIDGKSVLADMLAGLLAFNSKIVVVKKQVAGKGEAEVYFQLQR